MTMDSAGAVHEDTGRRLSMNEMTWGGHASRPFDCDKEIAA